MSVLYFLVVLAVGGSGQPDTAALSFTQYETLESCETAKTEFAGKLVDGRVVAEEDSMVYMETENTDYAFGCVASEQPVGE